MGQMQLYEFEAGHCQQIDANLTTCGDNRSIISGMVTDKCGNPVCNAVVQLYEIDKRCSGNIKPVTHTFTDEFGAFLFGPLCPGMCYGVKVWSMNTNQVHSHYSFDCKENKGCIKGQHKHGCGCKCNCDHKCGCDREWGKECGCHEHDKGYDNCGCGCGHAR